MGSPISGLFVEFKSRRLDERTLAEFDMKSKVWYRFVDDIFIIWENNLHDLHIFLNKINELHDNTKFTLEIETHESYLFLMLI